MDRVDFTPTLSEYPVVMYFVRSNEQPWNIKIDILSAAVVDYSRVRNRIRRGVTSVSGKLVKTKDMTCLNVSGIIMEAVIC